MGDLAHRLPLLADAVARANLEGRIDDADLYTDQFDRGVFELADSISGALQLLRVMADNKFSNVSTLAEKKAAERVLHRTPRSSVTRCCCCRRMG